VFACEPQPIVIEGLRKVLADCEDLEFAGAVAKMDDALEPVQRLRPDVALIDLNGGMAAALRLIAGLKTACPSCSAVLWVVELREMEAFRAFQMGVRGVVRKSLAVKELVECLRQVGSGKIWVEASDQVPEFLERKDASRLTPREKEVARLVCQGMKNKQIAENLHITAGTVKVHLMHIFEKTGLQDRLALAVHGRELVGAEASSG
jgi:two-component system nitrate/nitrite response regulator NarL